MTATFRAALAVVLMALLAALAPAAVAPAASSSSSGWSWRTVYKDGFGGPKLHPAWARYDGPYGSGVENYARPDHFYLDGNGHLVLLMKYRRSGDDGAAWYTGGASLKGFEGRFQAITIRYRVDSDGVQSHRNIPMRWVHDDAYASYEGEENYNEGSSLNSATTFLHYADGKQLYREHKVDVTKWHRWRFAHRPDDTIVVFRDGELVWKYRGNSTTLPHALRRVVLQQEVSEKHMPRGTSGRERILIDYMKVQTSSRG